MAQNNTTRFSNRVADYVAYRPGYPESIVDFLENDYGLEKGDLIADIGSGTGISSALFLKRGYRVTGIEPNKEMREKSVALLGGDPGFNAVDSTAENTQLPGRSVDAIIAGQAFHWFDRDKARQEFSRILKPGGVVALIWNERLTAGEFEGEYDELIVRHAIDYVKVDHRNIDLEKIKVFFDPAAVELKIFPNHQDFDFNGLEGRLLSSSYMPAKNEPGYEAMSTDLRALFDRYQENGVIRINYDTKVFAGTYV